MVVSKETESAMPNKDAADLPARDGMAIPNTVDGEMLLAKMLTDRAAARMKAAKDLVATHDPPPARRPNSH